MKDTVKKAAILLSAALIFTGCGSKEQENDTKDTNINTEAQSQETADAPKEEAADQAGTKDQEEKPYILTFTGKTTEGEAITSDIFADSKLTMINVWATFCGPCINEMPDLGELAGAYDPSEFQLIGIVSDVMEEDDSLLEEARTLIEETGADYPHLLLNEALYMDLVGASDSVPTTYFFDQDGALLGYLVGALSKEDWGDIIDELLEGLEK